ncbi:DUF1127 domain-containing protein [Cereibacter changlensis]|jgi:uncharacterized protein YjiS (DUF1127 family)|uniref:DUF1127 domain-containing protein n=1 Tax=Cereibacter changlensis TaxID=402884 RepID=A0A4U0Z1M9_9RHOB|nr:DUF1127 domain-containing protein [Cereibacter changlensis]TKA97179.1 DUF1127 domain-containing protein [Cereibacter changlensis]
MQRSLPMTPGLNLNRPMPILSRLLFSLAATVLAWETRRQTRVSLSRLDPHLLKDIGLTEKAAALEAQKPFWQG